MNVISIGSFEYEIDDDAIGDIQSIQFTFKPACDDLWDKSYELFLKAKKDDFAYRHQICSGQEIMDASDGIIELMSVFNDDRQAVAFHLVQQLMQQAFLIGASRAIEGLDPFVSDRRTAKMKMVRSGKTDSFTAIQEAMIRKAIDEHGPKVANIQKSLRREGLDVSDDTVRRGKKNDAALT